MINIRIHIFLYSYLAVPESQEVVPAFLNRPQRAEIGVDTVESRHKELTVQFSQRLRTERNKTKSKSILVEKKLEPGSSWSSDFDPQRS